MKIIKFGGKSLANGDGLKQVISILKNKHQSGEQVVVVLSARGDSTDRLENILELAKNGKSFSEEFRAFKEYQLDPCDNICLEEEFDLLERIFEGVQLLGDYSNKVKDKVLSQGELLSVKVVTILLKENGLKAELTDTRKLIITNKNHGDAQPFEAVSRKNIRDHFKKLEAGAIAVVTGFIASDQEGETTTLGRNGSNYTASLLANYLDAEEFQNYTHVNGIYTANPEWVHNAKKITHLSFQEANELANFGASILHAKTIVPLIEKNIPLRILNTFNPENEGTLISSENNGKGIKSINVINDVTLVNFEGQGLLGKVGIDARIFNSLSRENISVNIISQGSSERAIGFIIKTADAARAKETLEQEFESDIEKKDVHGITFNNEVVIISTVGQDLKTFHNAFYSLVKNDIEPILINNTLSGKNVCLVIHKKDLRKTVNVIHGEIFGISKRVNIAVFGKGLIGGTLIEQINESREKVLRRKNIDLNIFAISNSKKVLLNKDGISENWTADFDKKAINYGLEDIISYTKKHHLENLIAVDVTASEDFVYHYTDLIENGFDLVSANKIGNTIDYGFYKDLREQLRLNQKEYLYETNVGAGLPLIDTIKLLHLSGENITRIKGVFSGSLSYLFNTFSVEDISFSEVLENAISRGYTEPDPREDLCGNDVGRKLLILARELDLISEFGDISIHNLIPENLRNGEVTEFLSRIDELDDVYHEIKEKQESNHVLRYVGDLSGDLSREDGGLLEVKLESVPGDSALGQVKGSDSIFEIYTESYGEQPLVIQGAGAGAQVTARGVFGDILRLAEKNNK
ncbi:bifunctional aspartate kinase/homoserine dehydrogenase I [Leptobacterium flavescens]|uniref:Bifunctional aspartate kinase/homoserine dehydrogenase I n=1 Tax=Leptobacterium flavescens TaxID=472055 RepID=A0A6P0UKX2_9FLAO|nr:bifunctional aspartate kinase/homoserine dehydrogenase I [Leptobacterium flavescens]NER12529.1 bifunctional aspartate kinase/homoserine dehydrogenase I [Leptobacterium flavescens]